MIKLITAVIAVLNLFLVGCASTDSAPDSASSAFAETDDSSFSLGVGAFLTDRNSKARVDSTNGDRGTEVDLEDDLGLDNSDTVVRVDGFWRFAEKHRIDFSVFDLSRFASTPLAMYIDWKDTTFPVNANVDADFDLAIYKIAYTWLFLKEERGFLGATAGLYIADIGARLSATSDGSFEVSTATAPLPVIGFRGEYDGALAYLKFDF